MQLSRKTLQKTLSVIKMKVTPPDHPFQKTKWFWQSICFQNFQWETLLPLYTWLRKEQKSVNNIWMFLMQSRLLEQSLNSWLIQKEKTRKEKNCYKNNVLSKGKLSAEILQVLLCSGTKWSGEQAKTS